jgi:hypothetical protein
VFAFERRNHSRTGVYGILCMRVSVDTTSPVDKLKKAKKSFKFDRFDVLFQPIRSFLGQPSPEGRTERGAARMGGLPFDSVSPNRSLQSQTRTLQFAFGSASSALDMPSAAPLRKSMWSPQLLGVPALSRLFPSGRQILFPALFRVSQCCGKAGSNLPGVGIEKSGRPLSIRKEAIRKKAICRKEGTTSGHAHIRSNRVRHSVCNMGWVKVGMTSRIRKNMRGETTWRRHNERT